MTDSENRIQPNAVLPPSFSATKESLLTRSVAFLFVGFGLSVFLFLTHTWFYGFFSTAFTLLIIFVALLGIIGGLPAKDWHRTQIPFWRRLLHTFIWGVPVLFYIYFFQCGRILHESNIQGRTFENCFKEGFLLWFVYLLLGGRILAELVGMSWWRMEIGGAFALLHRALKQKRTP